MSLPIEADDGQVVDDFEAADARHVVLFRAQTDTLKNLEEVANNSRFSDEYVGAHVRNLLSKAEGESA